MTNKDRTELLIRRIFDKEVVVKYNKVGFGVGGSRVYTHTQNGTLSNESIIELFNLFKDYFKEYDFENDITLEKVNR